MLKNEEGSRFEKRRWRREGECERGTERCGRKKKVLGLIKRWRSEGECERGKERCGREKKVHGLKKRWRSEGECKRGKEKGERITDV